MIFVFVEVGPCKGVRLCADSGVKYGYFSALGCDFQGEPFVVGVCEDMLNLRYVFRRACTGAA